MSVQIKAVYVGAPPVPDPRTPGVVRYGPIALASGEQVYVDAAGGEPDAAAIAAVLNPPVTRIDYGAFRSRWTDAEKEALHAARSTSWQIDDFIGLAQAQGYIDLTTAATAKAAIVAAGALTQARADEIFSSEG